MTTKLLGVLLLALSCVMTYLILGPYFDTAVSVIKVRDYIGVFALVFYSNLAGILGGQGIKFIFGIGRNE